MKKSYRDRFFLVRLTRDEKKVRIALVFIFLILLIILGNLFYLTVTSLKKTTNLPSKLPLSQPTPTTMPATTPLPTHIPTSVPVQTNSSPSVKDYYIPLGSGVDNSNQINTWTNIPGAAAMIDFGNYTNIKEVLFEASVAIPTANETATVQLFNETDQHPVWYSPITLTDGQFVASAPIIYDSGLKLYQVQMQTSLGFQANLVQARIHVILQ